MTITPGSNKYILMFGVNKNKEVIQFNSECERITGYSREEVLGKNIFNFLISKDEAAKWEEVFDSIKKDDFVGDVILPLLTKNGSKIFVSCNTFPIDLSKAETGDICFIGEITNQDYPIKTPSIEDSYNQKHTSLQHDDKNLEEIFFDNVVTSKEVEEPKKFDKIRSSARQDVKNLFGKWFYFFFDTVGANKKKEELQAIARELDERRVLLNALEAELLEEKKELNNRRNEFSKWRDKLEFLEKEIEDRWLELENQEKMFRDRLASVSGKGLRFKPIKGEVGSSTFSGNIDKDESHHLVLDKIPACAAVIYRGILMQANGSFLELLGYGKDEVLGKSLFDFVAPENLEEIKRYYIDRLKGEEISSFETFIMTRDNKKMSVEINIKPSSYNGEKANLVVIKNLIK